MHKVILYLFTILSTINLLSSQDLPAFSSMDVFDLEWVTHPQISQDGDKIIYRRNAMDIMTDGKSGQLWMVNTDGTNHQKLTSFDANESNPAWSPDGKQIAFTASSKEGTELFVYWMETAKVARISQLDNSPGNLAWSPDGKWIAFTKFVNGSELSLVKPHHKPKGAKWADAPRVTSRLKHEADGSGYMKPGFSHIFIIPAEGGTARQLTTGNYNHRSKVEWSIDGKKIYLSANRIKDWEYDWRNSEIYSIEIANGSIQTLTDRKGPDRDVSISPDGKQIAYTGYNDKVQTYQLSRLYVMNVDGSSKREIKTNLDRSISSISWTSNSSGIYFMYDDKGNTKVAKTDLNGKVTKLTDDVGGVSIGRPYGGGSYSASGKGDIVFSYTTPNHPSELGFRKVNSTSITKVVSLNDDLLGQRTLGKVEELWYKSSFDGRDLQGWIVYPPFYDSSKEYPIIVENHGGPIANYGDRFSPEMQLYASSGYIVFYPNPRGSTSYGEEFGNLLYHNYPGEDYIDVMDGVDACIAEGIATEDNLFVTGGSAGGIMSAWMIGKNNRFRSAAVIKPVMNWISKTLVADNYFGYAHTRFPGQPWENFEEYWKFSPLSLVENIETPTLVMVGMSDLRTPPSEAKQLYHALKLRKIETALVEIPGSYHFISNRPSQLITKIEHIVAWFDLYKK